MIHCKYRYFKTQTPNGQDYLSIFLNIVIRSMESSSFRQGIRALFVNIGSFSRSNREWSSASFHMGVWGMGV